MAMKRVLGTFAAIILAASLVTGCGKSEATSQQAPSASAEEESADAEAEPADSNDESAEAVEAESEELTEESKVDEIKEEQPQAEEAREEETAKVETFPETVLFDQDDMKVTVEGFGINDLDRRTIKVNFVNNTSSEVKIKKIEMILDGYSVSTGGEAVAPAGETVSQEFTVNPFELEDSGILSIHDVSMNVEFTGDGLEESPMTSETVSFVTDQESAFEERDMNLFEELHNEDGIVVLAEPKAHLDMLGDAKVLILLENNSDDSLLIEPIFHYAEGGTHGGYKIVPPHVKYAISQSVHEGDSYFVRVSLVEGPHTHTKLFETDEVTVEMP